MADEITILNDKQLRQLAGLIYHQEVDAIRNINFQSEPELAKYLRDSKTNYESVLNLLDAGGELEPKFQDNNTKAPIAHDIFSYVVESVNNALQSVRNYTLRTSYLRKIKKHADTLMDAVKTLDPADVASAEDLAKEAVQFKKAMSECNKNHQGLRSRNFSRLVKEENLTLDQLVQRYQTKLKFGGPFENLEDEQKLQVYQKVIKASGREGFSGNLMSSIFGAAGIAVLVFAAGMMVWDIFSSEHIIKTATYDAVVTVASVGGAMLGEIVGTAVATGLVGVEASALFVLLAGFATSIAGAYILGEIAGSLVDLIFSSGGIAPSSTDGLKCYVAQMPDGIVLARQIAHQSTPTN